MSETDSPPPISEAWKDTITTLVESALFTFQRTPDARTFRILMDRMERNAVTLDRFPELSQQVATAFNEQGKVWWEARKDKLRAEIEQKNPLASEMARSSLKDLKFLARIGANVDTYAGELTDLIKQNTGVLEPIEEPEEVEELTPVPAA